MNQLTMMYKLMITAPMGSAYFHTIPPEVEKCCINAGCNDASQQLTQETTAQSHGVGKNVIAVILSQSLNTGVFYFTTNQIQDQLARWREGNTTSSSIATII